MGTRIERADSTPALSAYEGMAPVYDDFTAHYDSEGWMDDLLKLLLNHGLHGQRLLDVACGTGKSFLPMLPRAWQVVGCDISPAMLDIAMAKAGSAAELRIADMRELPRFGEFDLVWALDDAVNYLLSLAELTAALDGMRKNLSKGGLLLFDVNEAPAYRLFYSQTSVIERNGLRLIWRGLGLVEQADEAVYEARFEVEDPHDARPSRFMGEEIVHRQRYFSETDVLSALDQSDLECLGVYGHGLDGIPVQPLDAASHTKAIYIARQKGSSDDG